MRIRVTLACLAARIARFGLRLLGRGGTAVPGKIALIICPDLLHRLGKNVSTVIVTGTNGKSTTVGMLRKMLEALDMPYISNRSGANVISGITSDFIFASSLSGRPEADLAVMECDEGHFASVCKALQPKVVVVTNLFDDQVDRLGGAMQTRSALAEGLDSLPYTVLCLNADDSVSGSLAVGRDNRALYFGVDVPGGDSGDTFPCPQCGGTLAYDKKIYAHLGAWHCPQCGLARPAADFLLQELENAPEGGSQLKTVTPEGELRFHLALPALYNAYNALAALTGAWAMGWDIPRCATALGNFNAVFGRMETLTIGEYKAQMILVKNPAGFNRALDYAKDLSGDYFPIFCLNNHTGDGKDPSWIDGVCLEEFFRSRTFAEIGVFGTCAAEMKERLLRAGIGEERITVFDSVDALGYAVQRAGQNVVLFPNYTAMLAVREKLAALAGEKKFWE